MLKLSLTHEFCPGQCWAEVRLDALAPLEAIKARVAQLTGTDPAFMSIDVYDAAGKNTKRLTTSLKDAGVDETCRLHVLDSDPNSVLKQLRENQDVPKYELSEQRYMARPGNARAFLAQLRREQPERFAKPAPPAPATAAVDLDELCRAKFNASRAELAENGVDCHVKNTSINGQALWMGMVDELSAELRTKMSLNTIKDASGTGVVVGLRLPAPVGLFAGRDGARTLFDCNGSNSGLLVFADALELGHQADDEL